MRLRADPVSPGPHSALHTLIFSRGRSFLDSLRDQKISFFSAELYNEVKVEKAMLHSELSIRVFFFNLKS